MSGTVSYTHLDVYKRQGKVNDIYFDDRHWTVRYLVVNTGNWLTGRKVLLAPYALVAVNADEKNIVANLTKKQIEDSPSLDTDKPVSKQFESDYYGYYGWPTYWYGPYSWGYYPYLERDRTKWGLSLIHIYRISVQNFNFV